MPFASSDSSTLRAISPMSSISKPPLDRVYLDALHEAPEDAQGLVPGLRLGQGLVQGRLVTAQVRTYLPTNARLTSWKAGTNLRG